MTNVDLPEGFELNEFTPGVMISDGFSLYLEADCSCTEVWVPELPFCLLRDNESREVVGIIWWH